MSIRIYTVRVDVPIPARLRRHDEREDRPPVVALEVSSEGLTAWDEVNFTQCGADFRFANRDDPLAKHMGWDRPLTEIAHFDLVFRYLAGQFAANRTNAIGEFLAPCIAAMEADVAARDGSSVYFAEADGRVKIGWSKKVGTRIAQLQTGCPAPIRLLGTTSGGRKHERELHERFAAARVGGEWFELTPELRAHIEATVGGGP